MMKFVVNQLPYYGELCPLWTMCSKNAKEHECPRYWDKYKVCSDENPHECEHLFLCKGENYACQRSDKSGYSGRS